jgi:hypothetical protein
MDERTTERKITFKHIYLTDIGLSNAADIYIDIGTEFAAVFQIIVN